LLLEKEAAGSFASKKERKKTAAHFQIFSSSSFTFLIFYHKSKK
jgi:hypothetical protein